VFDFLFTFCLTLFPLNSFAFSSFIALFKEKRFNYDPGLYSRYFDMLYVQYLFIIIYASQKTSYIRLHRLCLSIGVSGLLLS
jgi:hypothetical protein